MGGNQPAVGKALLMHNKQLAGKTEYEWQRLVRQKQLQRKPGDQLTAWAPLSSQPLRTRSLIPHPTHMPFCFLQSQTETTWESPCRNTGSCGLGSVLTDTAEYSLRCLCSQLNHSHSFAIQQQTCSGGNDASGVQVKLLDKSIRVNLQPGKNSRR